MYIANGKECQVLDAWSVPSNVTSTCLFMTTLLENIKASLLNVIIVLSDISVNVVIVVNLLNQFS